MAKYIGRRCHVGLAKEATRGIPVSPTFWLPWTSTSFDDKVEKVREVSAFGNIADSDSAYVAGSYGQGTIEGEIRTNMLGLLMTNLLGASPTTAGADPYTHTYSFTNTNQHQSLSILIQDPNSAPANARMFTRCMINTFTITVDPIGTVKYSIEFIAGGVKDWVYQTPTFTTLGDKFLHQHLRLSLADTIGALPSTQLDTKHFEITFNKNLMIDWMNGTLAPADVLNQSYSVEGNVQLNYEDYTWRNYMVNSTYKAMEFQLYKDGNASLRFQFPRVDFYDWEANKDLDAIVTQTLSFKANIDTANAYNMIYLATLINQYNGANY